MMQARWGITCLVFVLGAVLAERTAAGDPPAAKAGSAAKPELPAFTPQREEAALRFIAEHHPELGEVLGPLKTFSRDQYEQAIRELSQTIDRMAAVQENDKELYELMLTAWKVNSQIEVLTARLASSKEPDAASEAELKSLLYRQIDLQRQQVEHNRERVLASLKSMEAGIKWLTENRDQLAERRFQHLIQVRQKMQRKQQEAGTPPPAAAPRKK
jgi:hypothetical protein